ncbi:MAG: YbaB/EbfC family nucleoid-associated protein [Ndongobacter sp.]|nr:YbaB/EbfC family nucleoid-associated protein [Ndongobacter sp.]
MAKGRGGFGGAGNMNNMMRQMQKIQRQMEEAQAKVDETELETSAGGGAVTVRINGKKEILSIKLDPSSVDPEDVEMLEDMLLVAVNDAIHQASQLQESEMGRITGGLSIPGLL